MQVIIDIGNSDIVTALYDKGAWGQSWRMPSHTQMQPSDCERKVRQTLLDLSVSSGTIQAIAISSVVPPLTSIVIEAWRSLTGLQAFVLDPPSLTSIKLKINNPYQIGSDLVANAYAGFHLFRQGCIVVDFGTALTFTMVSQESEILGVAIAPGLRTAIKALTQNTAKLPEIELALPETVVGRDTIHAIRSGILYGYVGLVKEMVMRIREEVQEDLKVVATGGLSHVLNPLGEVFDRVEPNLTINGIRLIYEAESSN